MTFKKFLSVFILTFFVKFGFGQVYQSMPQYGYGPVKRFDVDSTLTIPTVCGVPTLKSNLVRKSAIAFDTCNNRFYYYNSKMLVWDTIKGGSGSTIDTANKWVNSVTKVNDSTIRVVKGTSTNDIIINPQATRLVTLVYNKSGATIPKGAVIYINGKHSNNLPSIALALGNNEDNSYKTFALVADSIQNMNSGYIIQAGTITGLNLPTNTYTDGDILYLSPTSAGGYTTTKPLASNHIVKLGSVVNAHPTQGRIEIKIENGWQLDELSDVKIAAVPNDSTLLQFSRVDSLWHDVSVTNAIGTKYLKPTDTASLSNRINLKQNSGTYLTPSDTTSLSNRINSKQNAGTYLTPSDTSSLSNRINLKMNYSDTASLSNRINLKQNAGTYLVPSDTTSLSNRINLKVNISDTATMLTNYAKTSAVNLKVNISDTASMLTNYAKTSAVNLKLNISDTSTMLSNYYRRTDTILNTKFRVNFSASTTDFPVIIKNTNASAVQSNVLSFDCSATGADQPVFINLASTAAKGMVFFASNQATSATPAGAGFQIYSTTSTNFPGQMYFDGGAHNSSSIIFRTAQTSGTISQRMRIFAGGNVNIGSSGTDAGYLLNVQGTIRGTQFYLSALNTAPASATATGTLGEIRIDANYIYICTATNTWKRAAIATW